MMMCIGDPHMANARAMAFGPFAVKQDRRVSRTNGRPDGEYWDARLEAVAKRMRCSKCGKKQCAARAVLAKKPRG
jgi:hypothetical protein